jgi:hypothetical protein
LRGVLVKARADRALGELASLLKSSKEWRDFFRECSEAGALRLRSQARQFRAELREGGRGDLALADVEDSLLVIARKVLPRALAAQWDEVWAAELCGDALARIAEHYASISAVEREVLDLGAGEAWQDEMHRAALANDPAAFRTALAGWESEVLGAMDQARRGAA